MWVFAPFGVLMPGEIPAKHVPAGSDRTLQVRARCAHHLDILREKYMGDDLGPTVATPGMDYNFRAYCTKEAFAVACYKMALDIDYVKFKQTTEEKYNDKKLHDVYVSIWSVLTRLNAPYGGKNSWSVKHGNGTQTKGSQSKGGKKAGQQELPLMSPETEAYWTFKDLDEGLLKADEAYERLAQLPNDVWKQFAKEEEIPLLTRLSRNFKRRQRRAMRKANQVEAQKAGAPF